MEIPIKVPNICWY